MGTANWVEGGGGDLGYEGCLCMGTFHADGGGGGPGLQSQGSRGKKLRLTEAREDDSEQTPLSEEMCSRRHFPTCGAREKGVRLGVRQEQGGLRIPSTLTLGPVS